MARPFLSDDERAVRSAQLLQAARQLFQVSQELPSVAAIAQAAGVAKGSVYLFFGSKEEIFIALLEDSFASLLAVIIPGVHGLTADPRAAAEDFSLLYAYALANVPELLPLAAMANSVLEKNLPVAKMLAFKERLASGLEAAAAALSAGQLGLHRMQAIDLLLRTWSLTLGLWQALDFPQELRPHLKVSPLDVFDRDFFVEVSDSVRVMWIGTLTG